MSDNRPRILILSASVGSGHLRAAEAIALALRELRLDARVRHVDVLSLATGVFRWCYAGFYRELIRHAPKVLGHIYRAFEGPVPAGSRPWYRLRVFLERHQLHPFLDLLRSEPWDLVINTFFLPGEIVASLRRLGRFTAPQVMVTTDFAAHRNWLTEPCDLYFTATEEAARYFERNGVPPGAVRVTGIPIHPVFSQPKSSAACRRRHGFRDDRPVLLLLAGGPADGPVEEPLRALLQVATPAQVVVVTGRNRDLRARFQAVAAPPRHRVHVLGFTNAMDELLAAADLVLTKPGGLTISEALARGAGLVLLNPIPGQEERNRDYLLAHDAAIQAHDAHTLPHQVEDVLRNPNRLARLRQSARRLGRPRAAFEVAEQALGLLDVRSVRRSRPTPTAAG